MLFEKALVPLPVYQEILKGIEDGYHFLEKIDEAMQQGEWLILASLDAKERKGFKSLAGKLGHGEAAGIAIALERRLIFFSDDRIAREEALAQGVEVSGTIGILKLAVKEQVISLEEANGLLSQMVEAGYRAPVRFIEEI